MKRHYIYPYPSGLRHLGCYYVNRNSRALGLLERLTPDLQDNPTTRTQPLRKCALAAQQYSFDLFALSAGYCISGSNDIMDYQYVRSESCMDGKGAFVSGYFIMDVYEILDNQRFQDSVSSVEEEEVTTLPPITTIGDLDASLSAGRGGATGVYVYSMWLLTASLILTLLVL